MRSILKRLWKLVSHAQVLAVFLAFALMVAFSYRFMRDIVYSNLLKNVDDVYMNAQELIDIDLLEPKSVLAVISENIRMMILSGSGVDEITRYLVNLSNYIIENEEHLMSYTDGVYGYFNVFDRYISNSGWVPPPEYVPAERPWYRTALEANGNVGISEPYPDFLQNTSMITFSRQIFDDSGNPLGVVCLDVKLDRISNFAINTVITENSYGILMDGNFNVIAHPNPDYLNRNITLLNDGEAIRDILLSGNSISQRTATDYLGRESVLFARKLNNGWYLAVLTYSKEYYKSVTDMGSILIVLAFIFAVALSAVLLRIISSKRKAEERMMVMLDNAPVGVTMWDKDLNLLDFNYEASRVLGIHNKQEYREKFYETVPEFQPDGSKSTEKMAEVINSAFELGTNRTVWHQNMANGGETIPFDAQAFRISYKEDYAVIVYCRDLRELNAAIQKMREADERTQVMLDATPLAAEFWDKDFHMIDCNQAAVRLFNLQDKNEYIRRFTELSPEYQSDGKLSRAKSRECLQKAYNEGYYRFEWLHRHLNGDLMPSEVTLVRVMFKNENIICGYTRDLRELKTMMAKMREADECTQILFNTSPLSCVMIDNTFKPVECNQEIERLFEIPDKQIFIEKYGDFSPEYQPSGELSKELMQKRICEAFEEGYSRFEWEYRTLSGEPIPAEVSLVRVKFKGVYSVAAYIRDLREINAMIAEMRRAEVAEESSKAKSDFLAKMSHEIRTPMNAILGITEIQLQDSKLPLATKEALERIYSSGDMLLGIINDILDLSKIEAGKFELVCSNYDIPSLIHDIVKLCLIRYESKPIEFKLIVSEDIPCTLYGDELRIKQILNNLLTNAFKYTNEGQVELCVSAQSAQDNSEIVLIFVISDTGIGMTSEQVKKLGDKFSRFNMEANRQTEGTGLGMNITQNLIKMMNGEIYVESTPGMGTSFKLRLPQKCADKKPLGKKLTENLMKLNLKNTPKMRNSQITQEFMPYGSVLIVDDVETNLYVARGLLTIYGLKIDTVLSGFEAVDKVRNGEVYDIIFMDHMMPRMDGIEATKLIRNLGYSKPIVALTANAIAGQSEVFLNNGFDDYISKPIDIRQLNMVLNKLIRDKQPPEVLENAQRLKNELYAAGDHKIAIDQQLAEYFVRDAEKAVSVMEIICKNSFRRADDIPIFIINIHAMKSALANVGEGELSADAAQMEQAGREGNIKLILSALPDFLKSLHGVIDKLKPSDNEEEEHYGDEGEARQFLQEKLLAIENACRDYDKKAAKDALAQLKAKTWPKEVKNRLSAISEHLLHSEFEEAAAIAREAYFT